MDGLIHAALEAEVILNRAKHVNTNLSPFDSGVPDHKMTWTHDKMHLAEPLDESRMKFQRSVGGTPSKSVEKFDLFKKLHEMYNELSRDEVLHGNYQGLKTTSYLLEKLLAKYSLNTLIINLYPGNKGYSLSLKINGNAQYNAGDANTSTSQEETLIETPRWPYEEEDLLSYIDNEELPVVLLDLLESEHSCLFYSGCIIAQIRDYRQAYPSFLCDTHHVLLRPTNQSIITDASCIGGRCGWAGEERGALEAVESALVHASAPPLCLDPRPAVGLLAARLHAAPRLFNTPRIRRQARRFSQVAVNRKRKLDQFTHYHGLELLDLIHRQRAKNSRQSVPHTRLTSKYPKKPPEVFKPIEPPKMEPLPLALPSEPSAPLRLARAYERPRPTPDCQPQLVEEYILETEKTSPHAGAGFFHIKLSILQRPADQEFLGELYVDRDHVEGERNGAACRFTLGLYYYIQLFDCQPQLVEEYILETEKTSPHAGAGFFHIKLSILQRPADQEFLGELYVDRDHVEGERNGAACRFTLGLYYYIQLFDCQPQLVEEYILETEKTSPHAGAGFFHIKLSILQRPADQEFLGELYVDRDHVEGERNGAACRFTLGSRLQANKYIQQFTEIFTEEGRKSVRIKHIVPGQMPRVSFTGGMREMGQQLLLQQRSAAASNATVHTHATTVPVVTPAIAATPNTHTNARQLPILQAQLQQVASVGNVATVAGVGSVGTGVGNVGTVGVGVATAVAADAALKQQPSPTPRLEPQVQTASHDIHSTQASTNQLLAQQLTNPPQPLNPQKMQSAIIHIQHPLMSTAGTSQVQNIQYTSASTAQQKATITKPRTTNPAISALVTSLMNSAQQFQQAASQKSAAVSTASTSANKTILNLLNSAPAAMTHVTSTADSIEHKLLGRTVSIAGARLITATTASHTIPTYTQQVLGGYTCETNETTNVTSSESALLERLMGPETTAPASQTQPVCHVQGLSLASLQGLQGIQGLQNVQVQIPGLSAPISLSLNVSGAPSGLLVSVPPTTSVVLTNQPSVLSLPIAQLVGGGVKGAVRGGAVQVVRGAAQVVSSAGCVRAARPPPRPARPAHRVAAPHHLPTVRPGTAQFITQAQAQALTAQQVRRKSNPDSS